MVVRRTNYMAPRVLDKWEKDSVGIALWSNQQLTICNKSNQKIIFKMFVFFFKNPFY